MSKFKNTERKTKEAYENLGSDFGQARNGDAVKPAVLN